MWQTKRDRTRLDRIEQELLRYQRLAAAAPTSDEQQRYERHVKAKENELKTYSMYPLSIWLAGMSVCVVLMPWALLTRDRHPALGLVTGLITAAVVCGFHLWRRSRSAGKPSP